MDEKLYDIKMKKHARILVYIFVGTILFLFPLLKDDLLRRVNDLDGHIIQITYIAQTIREEKKIPLWNPYINQGIPISADPINSHYNPIFMFPYLIFPLEIAIRISYIAVVFFGALGMYLLLRNLSVDKKISILSTFLYVSSGYVVSRIIVGHYTLISSYSFLPYFLLSLYKLSEKSSLRWIFISALSILGMFFSGDVFSVWFSLLTMISIGIVHLLCTKKITFFLPISIFLLLGAVKIIPLIECIPHFSKTHSLFEGGENVVSLMYYLFLPVKMPFQYFGLEKYLETGFAWWEKVSFIGLFSLVGISVLFLRNNVHKKRWFRYFIIAFIVFLSILFQKTALSPYHHLVKAVPQLAIFHVPSRAYSFISILCIVFSALGFNIAYKKGRKKIRIIVLAFMVCNILSTGALTFYVISSDYNLRLNDYKDEYIKRLKLMKERDDSIYYIAQDILYYPLPQYYLIQKKLKTLCGKYSFQLINNPAKKYSELYYSSKIQSYSDIIPKYTIGTPYLELHKNYRSELYGLENNVFVYALKNYTPYIESSRPDTIVEDVTIGVNRIDVSVTSADNNRIIVHESFYPGWEVYEDGKKIPLQKDRFLSVLSKKGKHNYIFIFRPKSFYLGLSISIISFLIILKALIKKKSIKTNSENNKKK